MNKISDKSTSARSYYIHLYELLSKINNKKTIYIFVFLIFLILSAIFEISLLGFLFVLIKAFMDPQYYQGNFLFKFIFNILNIKNNNQLIFYLSIFFITTCIIAGVFRLFFHFLLSKYVYYFGKKITNLCYQKILYQDYINLYSQNTSETLSIFQKMTIINDSFYLTLHMIFNFVTFIFIFSILLYIDFNITIYASLFFISIYFIIILFFKKKVFVNASTISDGQSLNIKILRETFNGFRDILINNYQKFYQNIFEKSYSKLIKANEQTRFLYSAPRPVVETFLLSSIGIVIGLNANNYNSLEKLIPMIAVLAVASQRILPIINQLYSGHMTNVDATPHIYFILNFLKNSKKIKKNDKKIKPLKFNKKIVFKHVSFSYLKNKQNYILKDLNITIKYGSRVGIIGHSGSGKSTFGDLILGLLNPTEGKIFVDSNSIIDKKKSWYSNVASVPQNIFVTDQSIAENIAFGKPKNKIILNQVKKAAKMAQLSEFIETRENKYNHMIGEKGLKISTGQRQRIAIARALYKKSKLIIFDEATSSLDFEAETKVLNTIYGLNRKIYTSIIISHKLNNLKRCDHVYKIQNSKLIKIR
tara:strand:- start:1291 stop:3057 length:1767 start_codon:yes stop_codon:yes gene_type:complete